MNKKPINWVSARQTPAEEIIGELENVSEESTIMHHIKIKW